MPSWCFNMRILRPAFALGICVACLPAQSFKTLYNFGSAPDALKPEAGVAIGSGGVLYGVAAGGALGAGAVFSLTPPASPDTLWTEEVLHSFGAAGDGSDPAGAVTIARGAAGLPVLYGTTSGGGASNNGTVFALSPSSAPGEWTDTVLHSFAGGNDGAYPNAGVTMGKNGVLYGATVLGGNGGCPQCGTVFALTPPAPPGGAWSETVLYRFTFDSDGVFPYAGLTIGPGPQLFGTTEAGGAGDEKWGTVFSLIPAPEGPWTESVLHSFGANGSVRGGENPQVGVVAGVDGVLYGTTPGGGTLTNTGIVYSLTPPAAPGAHWIETVLHTFARDEDGYGPRGCVIIGPGGVLYGTTIYGGAAAYGTVYSLTPPVSPGGVWTETVLHSFSNAGDGGSPAGSLVIGANGVLYGTTESGGTAGNGTIFALTVN